MQQNGTNDREDYLREWADTMLDIWAEKLIAYDLIGSRLYKSLEHDLREQSGGDITKIEFTFNYYGIYVDKGTGKEFSIGNPGDLGFTPNRIPKPWYNIKFYYYTLKLAEKLAEIEGKEFIYIIKNVIEGRSYNGNIASK